MDFRSPLDEFEIARVAEKMIGEHGEEALTKIDDWVKNLNSEGFGTFAKSWELVREVIKDEQTSDDKICGHPPIKSHPVGRKE